MKRFSIVAFLLLSPLPALSQTLIPLQAGALMTAQFVNNSSYPNSQVYILITATNSAGQLSHLDLNGNLVPNVAGQNASSYSLSLAQILANNPAGLEFPPVMTSARMWISYGQPMNMPIAGGGGLVQPNLSNPSDPNNGIIFDWMEFNVGGGQFFGNTTQVDMFGIPYTMSLYSGTGSTLTGTVGIADCYSDIVNKYEAFMNSIPGASVFNSLVGPIRIVAPIHGSFAAGQPNGNYFDSYIASVWGTYGNGGVTPTTQDVFGATGALATDPVRDAALNRHVLGSPANYNNPAAYYQSGPANYYAEFWHTVSLGGLAYGFPYDDANNQASALVSNNPRGLVFTFSGCATTPTATFTPTKTFTPTFTSTFTPTKTFTPTFTFTKTFTPTNSSTFTSTATWTFTRTNTPTFTYSSTSTDSMTPTRTVTPTNTATATASLTATPSATPTNTSTFTFTKSYTPTATWTFTRTFTPTFTNSSTSTNSFTFTPTATWTFTRSNTPTSTSTFSNTPTQTFTSTGTSSFTSTATSTHTATDSMTPTRTVTPSATASSTPTDSTTPTPSATLTATPSATPSNTSTFTKTFTSSPTPTSTFTSTATFTATLTSTNTTIMPVATLTFTPPNTATYTPTASMTPSFTATRTPTFTSTTSFTATATHSFTASNTATTTRTFSFTPTFSSTPTRTASFTATRTFTVTSTPSFTPTFTATGTFTPTPTFSETPTSSQTATLSPTPSATPTATGQPDLFFISENLFTPDKPVQIHVVVTQYPGAYDLTVFNSAGELIKNFDSTYLNGPYDRTYSWDGTNKFGERVASGVYLISLTEPTHRRMARVLFVH